jgi:CRISPR-associated protein Cmr1
MKTRVPQQTNAPEVKPREDDRVRQVRHYKLITPLFGGGVEPNHADPITVVRGTEVRGHLRFWWRATRGGQFGGNLKKMRRREEEIWGSAAAKGNPRPSDVIISVEILERGKPLPAVDSKGKPVRNIGDVKSIYSYVAFPLRDDKSNPPVLQDVEFELTICYPSKWKQDVEAALWTWETFGGLGARTRRGFGALQLVSVDNKPKKPPNIEQIQTQVSNGLETHVIPGHWPEDVPHLTQNTLVVLAPKGGKTNAIEAWRYLTDRLKAFRPKPMKYVA